MMVLDVLKFIISSKDRKNIYNYLRNMMETSGVKNTYDELMQLRSIRDKIASFIIRDIGLIELIESNNEIVNKNFEFAFPIDTWVKKIAYRLGCNSKKVEEIKSYLIKKYKDSDTNPLKFAAGLWFLGVHSFDILLEDCLGVIEI